jgi:hypothetical protein
LSWIITCLWHGVRIGHRGPRHVGSACPRTWNVSGTIVSVDVDTVAHGAPIMLKIRTMKWLALCARFSVSSLSNAQDWPARSGEDQSCPSLPAARRTPSAGWWRRSSPDQLKESSRHREPAAARVARWARSSPPGPGPDGYTLVVVGNCLARHRAAAAAGHAVRPDEGLQPHRALRRAAGRCWR